MKTKVKSRTGGDSVIGGEVGGKGKKLMPEKKTKNVKRALFQEIEEDEEIDYLNFKRRSDSIVDYYDDDEDLDEDDDFDDDENFDDDFDDDEK